MDHSEHGLAATVTDLHSTFEGHVLPGTMFLLWALIWTAQRLSHRDPGGGATLEAGALVPVLKIVLPLIGVWVEIPGERWGPTATLMSLQHVTMYSAFALTGVVDLLAHWKVLPGATTYVAFAAAQTNAGFLFWTHAIHGGVDTVVHRILAGSFFVVAAVAALEARRPALGLGWLRIASQLVLGGWFVLGAWALYLSGWELDNPVNEGRSAMIFSWLVMAASAIVVSAWVYSVRRRPLAPELRLG